MCTLCCVCYSGHFHLVLLRTDQHLCWPPEYRNIRWKLLSECRQTTSPYHHNKLAKAPGEKMSSFVLGQRCCSALTDCELRFCWLQLCLCTRQPFMKNKIMHHFLEPLCYRHDNTSHHGPVTQPTPLTSFPSLSCSCSRGMTSWIALERSRRGCCLSWSRTRPRRKTPTDPSKTRGMVGVTVWVVVVVGHLFKARPYGLPPLLSSQ